MELLFAYVLKTMTAIEVNQLPPGTVESGHESGGSAERRGYQAWTQRLPPGTVSSIIAKLFTNEDDKQIHKTLGILALVSFLYRYFWVYPKTGTLGFDGTWFDHLTMLLHLALSCTSLLFHVIRQRILSRPMIIWAEYRLHAIIFSTRCFAVYLLGIIKPFEGTILERAVIPAVVLAHHLGADMVTAKHGSRDGVTTVRVLDKHSSDITAVLRFYAFYQFAALASHLTPNARLADLGFNTFIAIQSSAFLMTLYRKGVITELSHAFWYTACLVVSLFHIFRNCGNAMFIAKLAGAYLLRTNLRMNKYVLWLAFAVLSVPEVEEHITMKVVEVFGEASGLGVMGQLDLQWACQQHGVLTQVCGVLSNATA